MSKLEGTDFVKESAFKQAAAIASQLKLIEDDEDLDKVIERAERIAATSDLDLENIYRKLDEALIHSNNLQATRLIEEARDEVYRCMR
jgi:hypothetical protein